MKNFESLSQPFELVCETRLAGSLNSVCWNGSSGSLLVCVGSWSFRVGIVLRLSFWIPNFLRKVLKFFEIFSQLSGLIGKPNQPVHWVRLSGTAV